MDGQAAIDIELASDEAAKIAVTFTLIKGGLTNVRAPVVISGRYDGLPLAGSTKAFDKKLDSWLSRAVDLGIIGSGLGQLFPVSLERAFQEGRSNTPNLLLANMGAPGHFAKDDLRFLVSNITVAVKALRCDQVATTLIGTRRKEMPVDEAVVGFLQGIIDGYARFHAIAQAVTTTRDLFVQAAKRPLNVMIVEEDGKRLDDIENAIKAIGSDDSVQKLQLYVERGADVDPDPKTGVTADDTEPAMPLTLLRIARNKATGQAAGSKIHQTEIFQFSGVSERAAVPVREEVVNGFLARELPGRMIRTRSAEDRERWSAFFADCVVPTDFREVIEEATNLTLEVDETMAGYPWEMMAFEKYSRTTHLGIGATVSRQLRTLLSPPPSSPPALNDRLRVLIVADPASGSLSLKKAREEGETVAKILHRANMAWRGQYKISATVRIGARDDEEVKPLLDRVRALKETVESVDTCDPLEIAMLILKGEYDVVHFAGHGFFDREGERAGWVLDAQCQLSAREIFRVRQVPRLVFANACDSAEIGEAQQREQLVGLAQAFFLRGIPNFIGTGWEVDDGCAQECARWFYARVLGLKSPDADGVTGTSPPATIGNALREARHMTLKFKPASPSWGAYQHYGHVGEKLLPFANVEAPADKPETVRSAGTASVKSKSSGGKSMATASVQADSQRIFINGIDDDTGEYAVQPKTIDSLAKRVLARPGLSGFEDTHVDSPRSFALVFGVDSTKLEEAGWGVIFHEKTPDDVRAALKPLIDRRKQQAGALFKEFDYKGGEQTRAWLQRQRTSAGNVDPEIVPYYLLMVGPPDLIPFEFQYLMGVEYAVGRLSFATAAEYERYGRSVVAYETAQALPTAKQISYWGTRHEGDPATQMSAAMLIDPLANGMPDAVGALKRPIHADVGYQRLLAADDDATKERLLANFHAAKPPAFLFTASHGMAVRANKPNQLDTQGALLCQDWTGFGSVRPEHFLAASDIGNDANVNGLVAFLFACFGNGTPDIDQFPMDLSQAASAPKLAAKPFIAALPQRLLAHPNGGALAVIGHIDRAWGFSIQAPKVSGPQIGPFRNSLGFIMDGKPIGYALGGNFGARYASLSTALATAVSPTAPSTARLTDRDLVGLWLERNDAQNYLLLGDPAVRIRKDAFA